jgi:type IV pilus assembly protein PilV
MLSKNSFKNNVSHDEQGLTLIEVMVALAIFAVGFLAVGSMQITAINTNAKSRNSTTVINIAKDRAEQLMSQPYDHDLLRAGVHPDDYGDFTQANDDIDNDEDGQIDEAGETGHITISWTVIVDQPLLGTKSVRVTATRNARGQRSASFDFIKADL